MGISPTLCGLLLISEWNGEEISKKAIGPGHTGWISLP